MALPSIMKALIPAAGLGTRFLPATKAMPKEMVPIVDRPVIQYVVEEALSAGITDILLVISRGKRLIEEHFDRALPLEALLREKKQDALADSLRDLSTRANIHYVWQHEQRGLGHAVLCGRQHIGNEPFALLLGDTLMHPQNGVTATQRLCALHQKTGASVIALERVPQEKLSRYGVADVQPCGANEFLIKGLVEKPAHGQAPSDYAVASRYLLTPDIFDLIEKTPPGKNNEIQITDALCQLAQRATVHGCCVDSERLDIGNPLGFVKANLRIAMENPAWREEILSMMQSAWD